MFRPNYGADFLNTIGYEGDTLLRGVSGLPVVMNPADVAQGAGGDVIREAVNKALHQYDAIRTDGSETGTQATPAVTASQSLNPLSGITDWFNNAQGVVNRSLIGILGVAIVIVALLFFTKD